MRLLYLCHRIPYPPDKGDKIRSYHQVKYLAERHELDLFTLIDDPADLEHVGPLQQIVRSLSWERIHPLPARLLSLRALLLGEPMSVTYFRRRPLLSRLRAALEREAYDLALVFSSAMAPYLDGWSGPRALDFVDLDSAKWLSYAERLGRSPLGWLYRREGNFLRLLEQRQSERAELTLFCSTREEQDLRAFCAPRNVVTVPNGTDVDYFTPGPSDLPEHELVFTGAMDYRANIDAIVWFAEQVLPRVRAERAGTRLFVVGSNPSGEVEALAREHDVTVTGRVPDVRPYLRAARIAVAPLRVARGIQNKVLEALACGVPVVATEAALSGIGRAEGVIPCGEQAEEMARAILALLDDQRERRRLGLAGRQFVVDRFCWDRQLGRLEELLVEAASAAATPAAGKA